MQGEHVSSSMHMSRVLQTCFIIPMLHHRTTTDEKKMLVMLQSCCDQHQKCQDSVYLQLFDRNRHMYRAEVTEVSRGCFKLQEVWCTKSIADIKADFICFGRLLQTHILLLIE